MNYTIKSSTQDLNQLPSKAVGESFYFSRVGSESCQKYCNKKASKGGVCILKGRPRIHPAVSIEAYNSNK